MTVEQRWDGMGDHAFPDICILVYQSSLLLNCLAIRNHFSVVKRRVGGSLMKEGRKEGRKKEKERDKQMDLNSIHTIDTEQI